MKACDEGRPLSRPAKYVAQDLWTELGSWLIRYAPDKGEPNGQVHDVSSRGSRGVDAHPKARDVEGSEQKKWEAASSSCQSDGFGKANEGKAYYRDAMEQSAIGQELTSFHERYILSFEERMRPMSARVDR